MLKEALEKLETMAVQAAGATMLDIGVDPLKKYVVLNGKLEEIDLDPDPRSTRPATVADLWTMAENVLDADLRPEIWVGENGVQLIHTAADRRDVSVCCFTASRPFNTLKSLEKLPAFPQTTFVRFLRFQLGAPVETILPFRAINWTTKGATRGAAGAASAAYGKQIEQEVTGNEPLPDVIRLDVPLWDTPGEKTPYRVELGVEYNHAEQTITICPLPGSLEAAITAHQEDVFSRLRAMHETRPEADLTIFRGWPE